MPMRLFNEREFEQQLEKHDITPTTETSADLKVWQTKSGHPILIPCALEDYPDFLLDEAIKIRDRLEEDGGTDVGMVNPPST